MESRNCCIKGKVYPRDPAACCHLPQLLSDNFIRILDYDATRGERGHSAFQCLKALRNIIAHVKGWSDTDHIDYRYMDDGLQEILLKKLSLLLIRIWAVSTRHGKAVIRFSPGAGIRWAWDPPK